MSLDICLVMLVLIENTPRTAENYREMWDFGGNIVGPCSPQPSDANHGKSQWNSHEILDPDRPIPTNILNIIASVEMGLKDQPMQELAY